MKKVALYVRVSSTDGRQTVENQKIILVDFAKRNNLEYDIFEEEESTRKTRPVKQALLMKLRNFEYESVIIYKLDRWARSSTELILDTKELVDKGIGFISLTDNLDFSSAAGRLQFQILSAFAEFERSLISQRTKDGLARVRAKNPEKKLGRPVGSKDSKSRKKSGYILREAKKRKSFDEQAGNFKSIESYLDQIK
ncbi:MAG: recombinase family protein [Paludibacter sp.]|nr:recombinase family protein [Paludibacter sp.]